MQSLRSQVDSMLADKGFEFAALSSSKVQAFATEKLDHLALTFVLDVALNDRALSGDGSDRRGRARITGDGTFDTRSKRVVAVSLDRIETMFLDDTGLEVRSANIVIGAASIYLGPQPPTPWETRAPIEDADS